MNKLASAMIAAAVAALTFNVQAASHAGAAPMKASEPMKKDDGKKKEEKKDAAKKEDKKASAPK